MAANHPDPYVIHRPSGAERPVVISVPHCGIEVPSASRAMFRPEVLTKPVDTDWYVHELYEFAASFGYTLIHAQYSRFLIDLNRDPNGKKLYADKRIETSLVPTNTFIGDPLYKGATPDDAEIERRKDQYFWPYYRAIENRIKELRQTFPNVLFFDAHSIKRLVPTIRTQPFPDLILGNQEGTTAAPSVIEAALKSLQASTYSVNHNNPFKGGYLTRYFGNPSQGVHALQLEMSQDIYMDEDKVLKVPERFQALSATLQKMLAATVDAVEALR